MRVALGPGAALAAWLSVLVALNATDDALLCGAAFASLSCLAWVSGQRRLLVLSLVVGAGLLLLVPGVAFVDGSFAFVFAEARMPMGVGEWIATLATALRVPAQVLAAAWLLAVPARLLLAGAARVSPDTALLGAITARLRPLLARDAVLVRDELASRGLRVTRGAPFVERARAVVALWESLVSGLLDRAFVTAAALHVRGWGAARPTQEDLRHPQLRDEVVRDPTTDRIMVALALVLGAGPVGARAAGHVAAPAPGLLPVQAQLPGAVELGLAVCVVAMALLPLRRRRVAMDEAGVAAAPVHAPAGDARSGQALQVRGASMRYPGARRPALMGVDLDVAPGELVVVVGPSGGGKSTLLDVVTGVAPATSGGVRGGVVRLGQHVLDGLACDARGQVAAVFQYPESQVLVGRVAEEVAFGLRQAGVAVAEIESRVLAILDQLDIRHLAGRDCATLSGGELQRVLLAAALVTDPALLVLDEPTSQVDAATEIRFWDAVDAVRARRGIGVLVAEHRLEHLVGRADRIVVVDGGRVLRELRPQQQPPELAVMLQDPYAGLAPAPVEPGHLRLAVRIDRLHAGSDANARTLLRGLAFAAPARSIITLEGPNGTGKSTLLRTIRGLVGDGDVLVDGRPRGEVGASADRIAWVSQAAGAMLPGRTVLHAATETSLRLGHSPEAAHAALHAAALAERSGCHPSELSVGQRQRLAIVAATSHRPPVWLLDEPTRGMDPASRRWVACHLLAHAAGGGVALVATHDPALAAAVATHRLRLDLRTGPSLLQVRRDASGPVRTPDRAGEAAPDAGEVPG
jgi:energy-coupling factor transport system ATP-binding protein